MLSIHRFAAASFAAVHRVFSLINWRLVFSQIDPYNMAPLPSLCHPKVEALSRKGDGNKEKPLIAAMYI
jgi:hypothetical protein